MDFNGTIYKAVDQTDLTDLETVKSSMQSLDGVRIAITTSRRKREWLCTDSLVELMFTKYGLHPNQTFNALRSLHTQELVNYPATTTTHLPYPFSEGEANQIRQYLNLPSEFRFPVPAVPPTSCLNVVTFRLQHKRQHAQSNDGISRALRSLH